MSTPRFLIDANLPYRFSLWQGSDFVHVFDLGDDWPDEKVWNYARSNDQVIVTKDSDFSHWIMLSAPPPRVVRFTVGNIRLRDFHVLANELWPRICQLVTDHKLVLVHRDRIEAIA